MGELLVFNPMTSASASLMMMEISTTTQLIRCKPILTTRQIYTMTIESKTEAKMSAMTKMKATAKTITMTIMNGQKGNKRLGVVGIVVLIVIRKK